MPANTPDSGVIDGPAGALRTAIFDNPNLSLIATDENGVIQLFNGGAERMLGYTAAEIVNRLTPAHLSDPQEVLARAVILGREHDAPIAPGVEAFVFNASRGVADEYELTFIRKDGGRFPALVSVTALRGPGGGIIGYLMISFDNSARKAAAAKLRPVEESFRLMVEGVTDYGIVMLDPAGSVMSWNAGAQRIKGYAADEVIGQHYSRFYTPHDVERGAPQRALDAATAQGRFESEGWRVRKDGSTFWAHVVLTATRDQAGNLRGFANLTRDQTQRRQIESAMANAKLVAEKNNVANADFLTSMSHELRVSLNAILGFAQLMESDSPLPTPAQKENIAKILQAGWYLMELTNSIRDLAVIESGRLSWSIEPVSLTDVMLECQATIEPQAQKSGIRMTFPMIDGQCFIKADRERVKQVLNNLLTNAIKYNQPGGSVVVACSASAPQRVRISVTDTGGGMSPEKLAQLFRPFGRVGQENSVDACTGIGLVVSKRLVELMGGTIGVRSNIRKGSVFWIELVAATAPQLAVGDAELAVLLQPATPSGTVPRTLLYVEDNPANLQLVEQIIARRPDLRLLSARNGTQGVELARAERPHVILMDINLPGMSGIKAMQILHADTATAHIPIVALSANAMPRDIERGLEAGFFRYLTKPIKVNEFLETLDIALKTPDRKAVSAHE